MKYVVILGDGMADLKIEELGNKTPLQVAKKPTIDNLAKRSVLGTCRTVPNGMKAGSDVANLSVLGYNPLESYSGRSPLEAVSIGITLKDTDVTLRANLVTLSGDGKYEDLTMQDYSSGEISSADAKVLIDYLRENLTVENCTLYNGISYRHCFVVDGGKTGANLTPPHDISKKPIANHLPKGENAELYLGVMKKSYELLKNHPLNIERIKNGKNPANSLWFWGEGTKPDIEKFHDRYGLNGGIISAVDLLKGIGISAGMKIIEVENATGNYDTNFSGKADACVNALLCGGLDYVYVHMEAPDECGHHADLAHKIYSIEQIDNVVKTVVEKLEKANEEFSLLIMPDHPTPIATMTHSSTPVPFMIYRSNETANTNNGGYDEDSCAKTGVFFESGASLAQKFLQK